MREALKEAEESLNILKKYSPEDAEIMLKGKR
jgi:hypothetical protein